MHVSMIKDRRMLIGAIAGLAGLAVLIGGGTFALWYDSEQISGADINSGELHLEVDPALAVWTNQAGAVPAIADYLIAPGDVLTLTQPVDITAIGDELDADFSMDASAITGDAALAAALETSMVIGALPAGMTGGPGTYDVTGDLGTVTVAVEVQITFPETTDGLALAPDRSNYWNLAAQTETVNLSSIVFDLVQTL